MHDPRGTQYAVGDERRLTTYELAYKLGLHHASVWRWCKAWFGPLPEGREGRSQGYRIPVEYWWVAQAWHQIHDPNLRPAIQEAIVESPRQYVVVVDKVVTTHYTIAEAIRRAEAILRHGQSSKGRNIQVLDLGPPLTKEETDE